MLLSNPPAALFTGSVSAAAASSSCAPASTISAIQPQLIEILEYFPSLLGHAGFVLVDELHQPAGIGGRGGESADPGIHAGIIDRMAETDGALPDVKNE